MLKQFFSIIIAATIALSLFSCSDSKEEQAEKAMDLLNKNLETAQKLAQGEISEEEAQEMFEKASGELQEMAQQNKTEVNGIPDWAEEIGFSDPADMTLDKNQSTITTEDTDKFNSMTLHYTGEYDVAMKNAEAIAKSANIPVSKMWLATKKMADQANKLAKATGQETEEIKGITYMNYDLGSKADGQYLLSVEVTEDGTLILSATDQVQMKNVMENSSVMQNIKKEMQKQQNNN